MNILVTGANGFVGKHLVAELVNHDHQVLAIGGPRGSDGTAQHSSVNYNQVDLSDKTAVATVDFTSTDAVIHLAGLAAVGPSFDDPMRYIETNIGIETNLFEAALAQGAPPRFLVISSGSLYDASAELPLTEQSSVIPSSPYAVSKLGQEYMALYYARRGFECIIARPFNHIGPGQAEGFIVADLAKQIIAVERGEANDIRVGNLDAQRDYTDVRDIARAYRLLIEQGKPGELYNICSGTPRSGHQVLDGLLAASATNPNTAKDASKMRPSDNPVIYGSHDKLTADTGWKPTIAFETSLSDALADWRSRI